MGQRGMGTMMTGFRTFVAAVCAVGLLTAGALGITATRAAWSPCAADQTLEPCLRAMDQPGHLATLQMLWLLCLALCVGALLASVRGRQRTLAVSALVVVLVMNALTEYLLWLEFAGGHWDVPPGTGYTQATAFVVAGMLVAVGVLLRDRSDEVVRGQTVKPGAHATLR